MRIAFADFLRGQTTEDIASFGDARLMKVDGRLQLCGGTKHDRLEALEWISLFMPDEVARLRDN